ANFVDAFVEKCPIRQRLRQRLPTKFSAPLTIATAFPGASRKTVPLLFFLDCLGVDLDFDFVAHHQAARLECLVVSHTVVLSTQLGSSFQSDPAVTPGILHRAA